jgi:hypothetical protein
MWISSPCWSRWTGWVRMSSTPPREVCQQVHSRVAQGRLVLPCHPYRQGAVCPHGRRVGCWHRHDPDDPRVGEPLCPDCYDARGQVLWNALAPELWRRTTIYLKRSLARLVGLHPTTSAGWCGCPTPRWRSFSVGARSTSTPSSVWTPPPPAPAPAASPHRRSCSPSPCSRMPSARPPPRSPPLPAPR